MQYTQNEDAEFFKTRYISTQVDKKGPIKTRCFLAMLIFANTMLCDNGNRQ